MKIVKNLKIGLSLVIKNVWLDILKPRTRKFRFIKAWVGVNYGFITQFASLPDENFFNLYPEAKDFLIPMEVQVSFLDNSLTHLYYLSCLGRIRQFKRIFEIGTATGSTSLQLARICKDAKVYTLNLYQEADDRFIVGSRFHNTPEEKRIVQLYGDSTTFNYKDYLGTIDLVFIDGGHDYKTCRADTINALNLIGSDGIIVWDDYPKWPGVKKTLEELYPKLIIYHITGSQMAIFDKRKQSETVTNSRE